MAETAPLILTLQLNPAAFAFFNQLRKKHFPEKINYLDAHLTLFHHLPNVPAVKELLEEVAARQKVISLEVTSVIKLGRGVAYKLESPVLKNLHAYLQKQWQPYLTPQDKQGLRPHVTVQNKVEPEIANKLYEELTAAFEPIRAEGVGFGLWEYRGGPWGKIKIYDFSAI
ncbi:2'-5' RNA ligase family protein [Adhaeribacter aquaticus]|uniref:2'-5' RNA ligase family protein n=1 Tax=Adhaeribacter aquaticus TaxID=299567 RepID=UPI0003F5E786|nr:2'-5' RNA ligase family protein [Adhaeribacter aquaticus]